MLLARENVDIAFRNTEFEVEYEGDLPWYCIVFSEKKTPARRRAIEKLLHHEGASDEIFSEDYFITVVWDDDNTRCSLECEIYPDRLEKWASEIQPQVRKMILKTHREHPISIVSFLDNEI